MESASARPWQVLLLGGASGTGKTRLSYRLARALEIGITEVDDFQVVLERMTTPEQLPALHFWRTHPDPGSLSAEEIHQQGLEILQVMLPARGGGRESPRVGHAARPGGRLHPSGTGCS
jgi:hypothetical protein